MRHAKLSVECLEDRCTPSSFQPAGPPRPTIFPRPDDPVYVRYSGMTDAEISAARAELSKRVDRFATTANSTPGGLWGVVGFVVSGKVVYDVAVQTVQLHREADEVKEVHHELNVIIFVRWERDQGRAR